MPLGSLPIADVLAEPPPAAPFRVAVVSGGTSAPDEIVSELTADLAIGLDLEPGATSLGLKDGDVFHGNKPIASRTVLELAGVRIGVLTGDRGLVPEEVRVLMLRGASVVLWATGDIEVPEAVARTRADENRIFLLTLDERWRWNLYAPNGTRVASGPAPGVAAALVELPLALSWYKEMVPGTDVLRGRLPSYSQSLASPKR